ncbi:hypothetical protein WME98_53640 [Sorangium sp. So ce296]|uniref:hypothetical protein n=1 Tax=unclassified Sorangium TaxID=2621164 RepID=UPI000B10AB10
MSVNAPPSRGTPSPAPVGDPEQGPPVQDPAPGEAPRRDPDPGEPARRDPPPPPPAPGEPSPEIEDPPAPGQPPKEPGVIAAAG